MALCVCGQLHANAETIDDGTDDLVPSGINEDMLRQIEPTYLKEVAVPSAWSSNWFVGVSGGTIYLCRKAAWYRELVRQDETFPGNKGRKMVHARDWWSV